MHFLLFLPYLLPTSWNLSFQHDLELGTSGHGLTALASQSQHSWFFLFGCPSFPSMKYHNLYHTTILHVGCCFSKKKELRVAGFLTPTESGTG